MSSFDHAEPRVTEAPSVSSETDVARITHSVNRQLLRMKEGSLFNRAEVQALWEQLKRLPVGEVDIHAAQWVKNLALGTTLESTPRFGLRYSNGTLEYCQIVDHLSIDELNSRDLIGRLFDERLFRETLASVDDPKLMSPHCGLADVVPPTSLEDLILLEHEKQRVTRFDSRYGPLVTTTYAELDGDTWAPNIDSILGVKWLIAQMEQKTHPILTTAEVGCGSGLHSTALLRVRDALGKKHAWSSESQQRVHTITDISSRAVNAGLRNCTPYLNGTRLDWFLGKGVSRLNEGGRLDLGICNPPYLPHHEGRDSVDRYSGTGLIRELFEYLPHILNRENPEAAFYMHASSLTERDLRTYEQQYPHVRLRQVSEAEHVPLRIYSVKSEPAWIDHLSQYGLVDYTGQGTAPLAQLYWHDISLWELTLR
jgi:hypothetical protein